MKQLQQLFILAALGSMGWLLYKQGLQISSLQLSVAVGPMLLASLGLVVLFFLDALGWHLILKALGRNPPVLASIRIWMVSSIARYLPGGIWSYTTRAGMSKSQDIGLACSTLGLYLETLMLTASSLAIGLPALLAANGLDINIWMAVAAWLVLGLGMHPGCLRLLHYLPGRIGKVFSRVQLPSVGQLFRLYLFYLAFWCLFCTCFVLFVQSIIPLPPELWLVTGSVLSLSFFIGFVVVFVPGGIGIREGAIYFLLSPHIPAAAALLIAISSRLWIMSGELIALSLTELLYRRYSQRPNGEHG